MSQKQSLLSHPTHLIWLACALLAGESLLAKNRSFIFSLPLVTIGRDAPVRAEYNLGKASLSADWVEWLGEVGKREELTQSELEEHPNDSMTSQGRELTLMVSRYKNSASMSGFHWGLGAGYRQVRAMWKKSAALMGDDPLTHNFVVSGPTYSGRLGYRYVGKDMGFMVGTYLGVRHFQNAVEDTELTQGETALSENDKNSLKRRMMSAMRIGLEMGWAF